LRKTVHLMTKIKFWIKNNSQTFNRVRSLYTRPTKFLLKINHFSFPIKINNFVFTSIKLHVVLYALDTWSECPFEVKNNHKETLWSEKFL
jgi:hypothetical protein